MSSLKTLANLLQTVASTVGTAVPGLSAAASVAMTIVNMIDQTNTNNAGLKNICSTIADIVFSIWNEWKNINKKGEELSSMVLEHIDVLNSTLSEIEKKCEKLNQQGRFKRFVYTWKNQGVIAEMTLELNHARELFKEMLLVNIAQVTEMLREMMSNNLNMSQGPAAEIEAHGDHLLVSGAANVKTTNHIRSTETPWINPPSGTRIHVTGKGVQVKSSGNITTTNFIGL